ncbi:MAG: DUF2029 domain-containing protein [Chloroflexi bacterium]|nr:DUF2029 domain-containing protein [Chloroflexota bacterium]
MTFTPMLAVLALGGVLVHALAAATVLYAIASGDGIGDWVSFYAAADIVRTGHASQLYDFAIQSSVQRQLFGGGLTPNAYPLPAFVALALSPLSALSFRASYAVFSVGNLAVLATLLLAAWRYLRGLPRGLRVGFVVLAALSTPVVNTLLLGQLDLLILGAVLGCYALLRSGRPLTAGAVLALALAKPHVAAAAILLLLLKGEWRALAGVALVGVPLLLGPALLFGPGTLVDQARLIASYPGSSTDYSVAAAMMVNVRGAVVSITGSSSVLLWAPPLAAIALVSLRAAVVCWRARPALDPQSWAIAIALPLLYSPHAHVQTLVLLLGAGALYLRAAWDAGRAPTLSWLLLTYVVIADLWLLSIAGLAVLFLPVLAIFQAFALHWPDAESPPEAAPLADAQATAFDQAETAPA